MKYDFNVVCIERDYIGNVYLIYYILFDFEFFLFFYGYGLCLVVGEF